MNSNMPSFIDMGHRSVWQFFLKTTIVALLFLLCVIRGSSYSLETEDIRLRAGLSLFRSVLTADMDIRDKKGADGSLLLVLIYRNNKNSAETMARNLEDSGSIHGIPIRAEVVTGTSLEQYSDEPPAGIFLFQEISDELGTVVNFGKTNKIIVFSPFEGDVEAGVLGGIHISERLLPYINLKTLNDSGVKIKPFFLRVSKHYER